MIALTTTIALAAADGPTPAIIAEPDGAPRGGVVVVIQEAFGLTGHIERVATALAEAGYLAVAPRCSIARGRRCSGTTTSPPSARSPTGASPPPAERSSGSAWGAAWRAPPRLDSSSAPPSPSTAAE